ncbi:hypothetical protein [Mesorhizobium sp. B4-1-4]|uniref:hypothetical protein n=1 Tax=Mesorhizobium sp. B4-1-4 TaxID=2589888 RepID=UPI0015E38CDB|nr:hypothetical protein [Mesorhizobium sp. B4-1-4]UCI34956.1 hypothetical protein FJW03_19495 [Mesorhizobium sp. B4-1-4]
MGDSFIESSWACHDPVSASVRLFHSPVETMLFPACRSAGDNDPVIMAGLTANKYFPLFVAAILAMAAEYYATSGNCFELNQFVFEAYRPSCLGRNRTT